MTMVTGIIFLDIVVVQHKNDNQFQGQLSSFKDTPSFFSSDLQQIRSFPSEKNSVNPVSLLSTTNDNVNSSVPWGDVHGFSPATNTTIFYNIFIPEQNAESVVQEIIKPQLEMMGDSIHGHATVYYNLIGSKYKLDTSANTGFDQHYSSNDRNPHRFCRSDSTLDCHFMRYYPAAFEEVTLTELHSYCRQHPTHDVIYLHDRGSFHGDPTNRKHEDRIRLTKALTSGVCGDNMKNRQCNVCSWRFKPLWYWHGQGNMFVAACKYVQHLKRPDHFSVKYEAMFEEALFRKTNSVSSKEKDKFTCFRTHLYDSERNVNSLAEYEKKVGDLTNLRLGRFHAEHWIWFHPDMVPCDLVFDKGDTVGGEDNKQLRGRLVDAPVTAFAKYPKRKKNRNEFFRMPGLLWQLDFLYGQVPAQDSWFWKFYQGTEKADPPCSSPSPVNLIEMRQRAPLRGIEGEKEGDEDSGLKLRVPSNVNHMAPRHVTDCNVTINSTVFTNGDFQLIWKDIDAVIESYRQTNVKNSKVSGGIFLYPRQAVYLVNIIEKLVDAKSNEARNNPTKNDKKDAAGELSKKSRPIRICETGFGAGHSAALFLSTSKVVEVVSFDKFDRPYQLDIVNSLKKRFPGRLRHVIGDSCKTVPAFMKDKNEAPCDFLHGSSLCRSDNIDLVQHAKPGTILTSTAMNSLKDRDVYFGPKAQWRKLRDGHCIEGIVCFEEESRKLEKSFIFSRNNESISHKFCFARTTGDCHYNIPGGFGEGGHGLEVIPVTKNDNLHNICPGFQFEPPN